MASSNVWAKKAPHSTGLAPDPVATATITACGTYAGNDTIYLVQNNLTQTSPGTCITLTGDDSSLALQGFSITGLGSGDGILIKSSASQDVIEAGGAVISGFAVGILDQGGNTTGDAVEVTSNKIGLELNGGFFNTNFWTNINAVSNTNQGIYINNCDYGCGVSDFNSSGNGGDGVLVTGSVGARVTVFTSTDNGGDGVHVGCAKGQSCGINAEVKVGDSVLMSPSIGGNAHDGVLLDYSEATAKDQVYLIDAGGNGTTSGFDLHDVTATCGDNHWVTNNYGTAAAGTVSPSPACIPLTPF